MLSRYLLAAMVGWLPAERAEWGRAMLAEYDRIDARARWAFAVSCGRAVLFAPMPNRRRALSAATTVLAGTIGTGIYAASAQLRVFAILLTIELALCGWLGVRGARRATVSPVLRIGLAIGVVGCLGLGVYGVRRYPGAGDDPTHLFAIVFATVLAGYGWLAMRPLRAPALARPAAIGALAFALVWILSPISIWYAISAAPVILLAVGGWAGRSTGDPLAGVTVGLWTALMGGVTLFAGAMGYTLIDALDAQPAAATYAVSDNLGGLILMLAYLPALGVLLGLAGSALAAASRQPPPSSFPYPARSSSQP